MEKFIAELEREQEKKVIQIETMDGDNLKKALEASHLLGEGIYRLKEFVVNYKFKDDDEEIQFFKVIKPRLCSHMIYYRKVYNFEMNRPVGAVDVQRAYIKKELAQIQDYIDTRLDFYRYYRSGSTYLDNCYFMRFNPDMDLYLDSSFFERDPLFSTNCDDKVAKILANDQFEVFLKSEFENLENYKPNPGDAIYPKVGIRLEAKKTDIIELIYALHSIGSFGSASLKSVVNFIEAVFTIELGNYSRTFAEMKLRNDPAPFLRRMKNGLLERMGRNKRNK